jgi:hypothetical protein
VKTGLLLLAAVLALGCADSHRLLDDAGRAATGDAAGTDARAVVRDATPRRDAPLPAVGVVCGPNRCRGDEICCNAECGVCSFPGECVDFGCPGGP